MDVEPHLAVCASFKVGRWSAKACQPIRFTALRHASWVAAVDKSRSSKSVEARGIWQLYDERLQFAQACDAHATDRFLEVGNVHGAWLAWSAAAESALASACAVAGGHIPGGGLVRCRGIARFRSVALSGPWVHRFHTDVADPSSASEVHMYRITRWSLALPEA